MFGYMNNLGKVQKLQFDQQDLDRGKRAVCWYVMWYHNSDLQEDNRFSHPIWFACRYMNSLGNKKVELFDMGAGVSEPTADENVQVASCEFDF